MREFYVRLIYKRVVQRCIDLGMPQQLLKLFNGHALSIAIVAIVRRNL